MRTWYLRQTYTLACLTTTKLPFSDEEDDEGPPNPNPSLSYDAAVAQEPELLHRTSATPLSPQSSASAAAASRLLGPAVSVWDPCNLLLRPRRPPTQPPRSSSSPTASAGTEPPARTSSEGVAPALSSPPRGGAKHEPSRCSSTCGGCSRRLVFKDVSASVEQDSFDRLGSKAIYALGYPNIMINQYGPWMDANLAIPLGPTKCQVIFDYFLDPSLAVSYNAYFSSLALE
uniref:Uncharacterized protein n=1 Tax=Ananas comosus var. bracteatus TaxID=296719 RepID=A0A6V7NH75_ANACO|nr:unnamed protein product [Ananas comosus var. bracteatus]